MPPGTLQLSVEKASYRCGIKPPYGSSAFYRKPSWGKP